MTKEFQAYGKAGRVTAATPRKAAQAYFEMAPTSRKCSVVEGESDGAFFTVRYGRSSEGDWPSSWRDVTKRQVPTLPDEGAPTK